MTDFVTPDFYLEHQGTVALLRPRNDAARSWLDENIYETDDDGVPANEVQWFGDAVVIEPRYVDDIVFGIIDAGLEVATR